jgi:hypothetical protein
LMSPYRRDCKSYRGHLIATLQNWHWTYL